MGLIDTVGGKTASLVLMHPTSLPDPADRVYGVGELGSEAFRFIDILSDSGTRAWQMLPLGHTGYGNSPYQTFSRFAGSPYLISIEKLYAVGDLPIHEHDAYMALVQGKALHRRRVDFGWLFRHKLGPGPHAEDAILRRAFSNFERLETDHPRHQAFVAFRDRNAAWLGDYAEYMALKEHHGHKPWSDWPEPFRDAAQWREARGRVLAHEPSIGHGIQFYEYLQFVFFEQWQALRDHAAERNCLLIGDIPWYVGYDSADVWARREVFDMNEAGVPLHVAGVPPDYFSPTGQLWGNPVYDWSNPLAMDWWVESICFILEMVDVLRLDHFRAIDTFWKVPWDHALRDQSARFGLWDTGPGARLLDAIGEAMAQRGKLQPGAPLPIIAEDLGGLDTLYESPEKYPEDWNTDQKYPLTEAFSKRLAARDADLGAGLNAEAGSYDPRKAIDTLLEQYGMPWMGVLQFGFQGAERYMPDSLEPDSVVYTGTHDNDTSLGWYRSICDHEDAAIEEKRQEAEACGEAFEPPAPECREAARILKRMGEELARARGLDAPPQLQDEDVPGAMCEIAWAAPSALAGAPLQDLLGLGGEARMNLPGDSKRTWWTWRATRNEIETSGLTDFLRRLNADAARQTASKE